MIMRKEILTCDIDDMNHGGLVSTKTIEVMFDHDQEDGKSKLSPYFEKVKLEMCEDCYNFMIENMRRIYAYGAQGYNKYYLKHLL